MRKAIQTLMLLCAGIGSTQAGDFTDQFFGPDDGWLDMSQWLIDNAYAFLPVPIVITEPAIGAGFRYQAARRLGLEIGIDVARGPEDTYYYLVAGSAWGN